VRDEEMLEGIVELFERHRGDDDCPSNSLVRDRG